MALTFAVPKGRILKALAPLLEQAGVDTAPLSADDRKLIRTTGDGTVSFVFLKPDDVPTYVEFGAADLGVCGRDTVAERRFDLLVPVDLGIGRCKLVVAAPRGKALPDRPRIATKYPEIATDHFAANGVEAEIIPVQGSVELAPLVGLADAIVDIVETGKTLRDNGMEVVADVMPVSSVLIVNRAAFRLQAATITPLIDKLQAIVL